jgi:hypothetical protein
MAIANPAAESYVRNQHSDTVPLAAAIFRENMKTNHYVASYGEAFRPHIRPFVIEATGAYGPIASAILKKIVEPADKHQRPNPELLKARNHFLRKVSVMIASTNAQLISFARAQMRQDGPGGVEVLPQEEQRPPIMPGDAWPRDLSQEDQDDLAQPEAQPEAEVEAHIRDRALVGEELSQAVDNVIQYMQQDYRNFERVMEDVRIDPASTMDGEALGAADEVD